MVTLVAKRIGLLIATVFVATTLLFVLIHTSGDPTQGFLAPGSSPELREATRHRLGLDLPIAEQYARFLWNGMTGNFGDSWRDRQPAMAALADRLPATLKLMACAVLLAVAIGTIAGIVAAALRPGLPRSSVRLLTLIGQAVPSFWLGTLFILLFAVRLRWLPSSGNDGWQAMILPSLTLAVYPASVIARLLESGLRDASTRPFVTVARAKGLPNRALWLWHVLPNAVMPALGYVGLQVSFLVGGTVIVESVFAYPGLGRFVLQSATERDLPVVQAFVVTTAILVVLTNLAIDLIAIRFDPRLQTRRGEAVAFG
jgi:peptide/nickel transport system permease protein